MLQVVGIARFFNGFMAVRDSNLSVKKGEIVAVIGPNGAGKTTLFNLITGQLKPDAGKILFKGIDITGRTPFHVCKLGIGRSYQVVNIFPRLSVFENVEVSVLSRRKMNYGFFPATRKLTVDETQNILKEVGLFDKSLMISGLLSHGDQKLLELAIALATKPELLILDEPTAGMSPEETFKTIELLKELSNQMGLTLLFCEHDMDLVFSIAQRIMVMRQGITITQGTPEEVRKNTEVQEAYLGESN